MNTMPSPLTGLPDEAAAMRALLTVLEREQACLAEGNADGCAALLEEKAAQVAALATLATQRHRRLATLGFAADEHGMSDWLRAAPAGSATDWAALMTVTRDAHELNRINGLLLAQLSARNRQALDALGLRTAGPGLYSAGGQADYATSRGARGIG